MTQQNLFAPACCGGAMATSVLRWSGFNHSKKGSTDYQGAREVC
jgi:hypothetical protein